MPPPISHQIVPCNWNNVRTSFGYPEPYSDRIICPTGRLDVRNVQSNKYDLFSGLVISFIAKTAQYFQRFTAMTPMLCGKVER